MNLAGKGKSCCKSESLKNKKSKFLTHLAFFLGGCGEGGFLWEKFVWYSKVSLDRRPVEDIYCQYITLCRSITSLDVITSDMYCIGRSNNMWSDDCCDFFSINISTFNWVITSNIWFGALASPLSVNYIVGWMFLLISWLSSQSLSTKKITVSSYDQCVGLAWAGQMIRHKFSLWETNDTCRWWYLQCGTKKHHKCGKTCSWKETLQDWYPHKWRKGLRKVLMRKRLKKMGQTLFHPPEEKNLFWLHI